MKPGATRDENTAALEAQYGIQAHPDHQSADGTNVSDGVQRETLPRKEDASKHETDQHRTNNVNKADQKTQGSDLTRKEDAFKHETDQHRTNNVNKADQKTQGSKDSSDQGDEDTEDPPNKENEANQNTRGGHRAEIVGADPFTVLNSTFLTISPPEFLYPTNSAIFCLFDPSRAYSRAVPPVFVFPHKLLSRFA